MSEYYKKLYFYATEDNQLLAKEIKRVNVINEVLQQRIDKAIEYIKENSSNYYVEEPHYRGVELLNIEELLEILGDKE